MIDRLKTHRLNLLILCQTQFGFHMDTFFYCKYLCKQHNVTYLCWDFSIPKQTMKNINVIYISRTGNILMRNFRYIMAAISYLRLHRVDVCFIKYFRGCSILKLLFSRQKFVFDIRSTNIRSSYFSRIVYDFCMRLESIIFRYVTVISKSLAKKLNLQKKASILPIGSIQISDHIKKFEDIRLLYIGTLTNRQIDKTIQGFSLFLQQKSPKKLSVSYTIIGDGQHNELEQLKAMVNKLKLTEHIKLLGQIPFTQLKVYFDNHNIGISFVPITPYFDVQPVTKTFDYLLSGLAVIATATSENKLVINKNNGLLIDDTVDGFASGIEETYKKRNQYKSHAIMEAAQIYHWKIIVKHLEEYLLNIYNSN